MPDYSNGKIYTIRCRTDDTLIYVGSTIQSLSKRWGQHKVDSIREKCKNRVIYTTINGYWDNWYIELYELYPCENKEQLCKREGEIIRLIGNLNCKIAGRTDKEYRDENKQKKYENSKEQRKIYRKEHKAELTAYNKEYLEANKEKFKEKITCECGCKIRKHDLTKHHKTQKHLLLTKQIKYEFIEDSD